MIAVTKLASFFLALQVIILADASSNLTPVGLVYYCPGEPLVFTCKVARVSSQSSIESLRWTVHFQEVSLSDVRPSYLASDNEGHTQMFPRDGHQFVFNLTVNNQSELVSTLTVTVSNDSASTINNATVTCGEDSHQNARIAAQGVPVSPIIANQTIELDEDRNGTFTLILKWNSSDVKMVNGYIISVSSLGPVMPEASIISSNYTSESIEISMLFNQEYNISVMANNCAGNSMAAETNVIIGYCDSPTIGPNVTIRGEGSGVEGTQITYFCLEAGQNMMPIKEMVSTCMSDGRWSPDPNDMDCFPITVDNGSSSTSQLLTISTVVTKDGKLAVYISTTLLLVVITILSTIAILVFASLVVLHFKVRKGSSTKVEDGIPSNDNNTPLSSTDNEEIGIYNLLQPEEHVSTLYNTATNLSDSEKKQVGEFIYADVGHSTSAQSDLPITLLGLSLQLDDDHVQYSAINHDQPTVDAVAENTEAGYSILDASSSTTVDDVLSDSTLDLDVLLIQLRQYVTPKWNQFGLTVGISKEQLEKYSGYPEEECIVEVVDYWLRNHPLSPSKPTWMDVAGALRDIELNELADIILNKYKKGQVNNMAISDDLPPPVPPKMFDSEEEIPGPLASLSPPGCKAIPHDDIPPPPIPPPYTETKRLSSLAPPLPPKNNLQT